MGNRNASASAFGWEFQINSAIFLMLENIKDAKRIRVEGADEDIEITLQNNSKIYAQAKSVMKPDDYSHVIDKLSDALETLSLAAKNNNGSLYTYVTNSPNPFNNQRTMSYFIGVTHLKYSELPNVAKTRIQDILKNNNENIDLNKLDVRVIPFYGDDLNNRYKVIHARINEFLEEMNIDVSGGCKEIHEIWRSELSKNATQGDVSISIGKEEMIWPLIVLAIEKTAANEYKIEFNDDEIEEIEQKYRRIINQETMDYSIITRVITGYKKSKKGKRSFVSENWEDYRDIVDGIKADDTMQQSLIQIILHRIVTQRDCILRIKSGVNL